jgi:hypothetical protein
MNMDKTKPMVSNLGPIQLDMSFPATFTGQLAKLVNQDYGVQRMLSARCVATTFAKHFDLIQTLIPR